MRYRIALTLALAAFPLALLAQEKSAEKPAAPPPPAEHKPSIPYDPKITDCRLQSTRTQMYDCTEAHLQRRNIQLNSAFAQNDANEILVAVRNMFDPSIKVFLVASREVISVASYPEEIDRIQAYIKQLDVPRKIYRLTFTLSDSDSGKRLGVQHFSIIATDGQRSTLKQGSKVPVSTGSYSDKGGTQQQFTYLDVGINIDVTPSSIANGIVLKTKIEQSSIGESSVIAGVQEPVIRQAVYDGVPALTLGKPLAIGQIDVPGSTRHLDLEVVADLIP